MHVAASQSIWCFICKWCSAMWLLTSPFLVAGLRSVSRVLRFLCRCRPSCTVLLFILAGKTTQYMCTLYWIPFPANMKSSTVQDGSNGKELKTSRLQINIEHRLAERVWCRTSIGREGWGTKSQPLLVNVYFWLGLAQGSTPRSCSFTSATV